MIAATLRSRVAPTSSLSAIRWITFATSTTSGSGIDFRANQMNVGTEAFQDGFWIIGNGGNFTGMNSASIGGQPGGRFLARDHGAGHS